jgi:hypothetical protein
VIDGYFVMVPPLPVSVHLDRSIEVKDCTTGHSYSDSQIVRILRKIHVTILSPQTLILLKSSPNIGRNSQKNIGPVEDSMTYSPLPGHMLMLAEVL